MSSKEKDLYKSLLGFWDFSLEDLFDLSDGFL